MKQQLFSKAGLVVLALLTLLLTIAISQVFKGFRIDLTEDKLFTLSEGTHNLLHGLKSNVTVQLFYSDKQTQDFPAVRNYARRVTELLEEYAAASGGKLKLKVIDPEPFSENEDKAAEYGLQAIPLDNGLHEVYLGLVISRDDEPEKREVISFLHPNKERFLEYDISKLIYSVTQTSKPKVGLLAGLPVQGGFDMASRQSTEAWTTITQLEQLYDVVSVKPNADKIPEGLKLLIIIQPKDLSERMRYAIDQFVLSGGNALIFVDPSAESESASGLGMMGMMGMDGGSSNQTPNLEPLFKAWGVTFDEKKVVADAKNALSVGSPSGRPVRHLGILGLSEASFNKEDVVTSSLTSINLATAGAIYPLDGAETTFETLLSSSKNSMLMNADAFSAMMDPSNLYKDFVPSGNEYTLIARVTGQVKTAYPNGQPKEERTEDTKDKDSNAKQPAKDKEKALDKKQVKDAKPKKMEDEKLKSVHLVASEKPINVIIVTDTDILTDRLWVQKSRFFGREIIQPFANNGDLLINMVDNLLGNADLISIRSRGQFARPFDRVNQLEQAAEANYHKKEDQLKKQLSETESKLHELQMKKQGVEKLTLNAEQTEELEKFMQEKLKIRKELREVQHQLGKNIEQLATTLKLINIFAVPVLITLIFFGFRFYRRRLHK